MIKEDKNLTGNSKYEGFCIDLLHRIASQVGFHYAITLVPDNKYGAYDPITKQWNGIVRELMDKVIIIIHHYINNLPRMVFIIKKCVYISESRLSHGFDDY